VGFDAHDGPPRRRAGAARHPLTGRQSIVRTLPEMSLSRITHMRRLLSFLAILLVLACTPADSALARGGGGGHGGGSHSSGTVQGSGHVNPSYHYTHSYYRRDGTYVQGYYATNPNGTKLDNYSTLGNVNPWTGKPGWIRPDGTETTSYPPREIPISNYQPQEVPISTAVPAPSGATSKSVAVERPGRTNSRRSAMVSPALDEGELYPVPVANTYHPHWTVGLSN